MFSLGLTIRGMSERSDGRDRAARGGRAGARGGVERRGGGGRIPASVTRAPAPLPPPRRAVAVLFLRVNRMAQPVISIRFPVPTQNDTLTDRKSTRLNSSHRCI